MTDPHRITYDLMPALTALIMYVVVSGFAAAFIYGIYRRLRTYFTGSPPPKFDHTIERITRAVINAFAQRKVLKKSYPGIMHLFIYSGIVVLFIGTTLVSQNVDVWEVFFHQ